jgi:threonine dehydrogenase-like Zn-dependent dehydrogenase
VEVPENMTDASAATAWMVAQALQASRVAPVAGRGFVSILGEDGLAIVLAQVLASRYPGSRVLADGELVLRACERLGLRHRRTADAGRRGDQDAVFVSAPSVIRLTLACEIVRPRGTIVLLGRVPMAPGDAGWSGVLERAGEREATLMSSRRPAPGSLAEALTLIDRGEVDPSIACDEAITPDAVEAWRGRHAERPATAWALVRFERT